MTDPTELFARLTAEVEDLHMLAIEGQSSELPPEASRMIVGQLCNGLQRLCCLLTRIDAALDERR